MRAPDKNGHCFGRRDVVVGTAWAVPVVLGVGVAPAAAASTSKDWTISVPEPYINMFAGSTPFIVSGTGHANKTFALYVTGLDGPISVTVDDSGDWTVSLSLYGPAVPQGLITFTPSGYDFTPSMRTAIKDTVAPDFRVGEATWEGITGHVDFTPGDAVGDLPVASQDLYCTTSDGTTCTVSGAITGNTYSWTATGAGALSRVGGRPLDPEGRGRERDPANHHLGPVRVERQTPTTSGVFDPHDERAVLLANDRLGSYF